jgi:hypothetical protein
MKMNNGGRKIASILMNHDVIFTSDERMNMLVFFAALLREVDYKRYQKMAAQGIL